MKNNELWIVNLIKKEQGLASQPTPVEKNLTYIHFTKKKCLKFG